MEPKDGLQWEMNNKTLAAAQPALLGAQLQPQLKNELCTLRHRLMSCQSASARDKDTHVLLTHVSQAGDRVPAAEQDTREATQWH